MAIVNVVPIAMCVTLLVVVHGRVNQSESQSCKMPFS